MADPFLNVGQFATDLGRALTAAESSQAGRLLKVLSDKIRERKPDVDEDAAKQVVFELVRDAVLYGEYDRFSDFTNTTSRRTESGTFDPDARLIDDYLTQRQKLLLGLVAHVKPAYTFGD